MGFAGASTGFVMIYLHPITIHLKVLMEKRTKEKMIENKESLNLKNEVEIPAFLEGKDTNYSFEFAIHGFIMAIGVAILIVNILELIGVLGS